MTLIASPVLRAHQRAWTPLHVIKRLCSFTLKSAAYLPLVFASQSWAVGPGDSAQPNVIVILADDMGYADAGFSGATDIPTPHLDSLAANGVWFRSGYVSAPQCAPSRAGLLTGIYQNRFQCEHNTQIVEDGIPPGVKLFGDYLRPAGYRTGIVGKWHLGSREGLHPLDRGFDFFFGFLDGASVYLPQGQQEFIPNILDGREPVQVRDYLTTVLGEQAVRFINQQPDQPFFLYLSFNAPHTPMHARPEDLEKFRSIEDPLRRTYAAMVYAMDEAIGMVLDDLRKTGREDNTLIFFLSDNGGPTFVNGASNAPLRGVKGDVLEGGVRVPFLMQWKGTIPGGEIIDTPVISLDLLPTAMAVAGVAVPPDVKLDGLNLLPLVKDRQELPDRELFWRFPHPPHTPVWATRRKDFKLVKEATRTAEDGKFDRKSKLGLYRVTADLAEENDLSSASPEVLQSMTSSYESWNGTLPEMYSAQGGR